MLCGWLSSSVARLVVNSTPPTLSSITLELLAAQQHWLIPERERGAVAVPTREREGGPTRLSRQQQIDFDDERSSGDHTVVIGTFQILSCQSDQGDPWIRWVLSGCWWSWLVARNMHMTHLNSNNSKQQQPSSKALDL